MQETVRCPACDGVDFTAVLEVIITRLPDEVLRQCPEFQEVSQAQPKAFACIACGTRIQIVNIGKKVKVVA